VIFVFRTQDASAVTAILASEASIARRRNRA
jgi:hypothetical protein